MKKLMYLAAALLVLVACDNQGNNAPERTPFKKGQQVTLTVGSANQGSQAPARTMSGVRSNDNIAFTWEEGDKILVKVGDKTAEFTLSSTPGSAYGEFTGTMPADGSTFDIQYPTTTPDLSAQVYTTDKAIPANSMLFTATDCTLDAPATLTAQYAMVQLNLFGTDKTVGKIVFTNKTANPAVSYTLTCTGGVAIGTTSATATPFYMVVPADTYQFEAEIWDNATTPAKICSFATSEAKTLTAGKCLNMPVKYVPTYVDLGLPSGTLWADCNVGATCGSTTASWYGDYFAWGEVAKKSNYATDWSNYFDFKEMSGSTPIFNKYNKDAKTLLDETEDVASVQWGSSWCMPTKEQCYELMVNCGCVWETDYLGISGLNGFKLVNKTDETKFIFLPAAGYQNGTEKQQFNNGLYWSKTLYTDFSMDRNAYYLSFYYTNPSLYGFILIQTTRYSGIVVRPVRK